MTMLTMLLSLTLLENDYPAPSSSPAVVQHMNGRPTMAVSSPNTAIRLTATFVLFPALWEQGQK